MLINFDTVMKNLNGSEITENDKPVAMKDFVVNALLSIQGEPNLAAQEKFERGLLATKVYDGGDLELTVEEIATVKKTIGLYYPPLIVAQIYKHIESDAPVKKLKK